MPPDDGHALGYRSVDDGRDVPFLVATMDATGRWDATRALRRWEREQLGLAARQRLLDVGCGPGDAALALAADLGAGGEVVGVDASAAMVAIARQRAAGAPCPVRFSVGDALALDEPDGAFDAARSERTLQWLADPAAAVAELARVVRPGGRLALVDTDWSTFALDVGDDELAAAVREAMRCERARPSHVGRRLGELVRAAGCTEVAETAATHVGTDWDPDESPVPPGCFSMRSLAEDLAAGGQIDRDDVDHFVATVQDAARRGRFTMSLTMHAVVAAKPAVG